MTKSSFSDTFELELLGTSPATNVASGIDPAPRTPLKRLSLRVFLFLGRKCHILNFVDLCNIIRFSTNHNCTRKNIFPKKCTSSIQPYIYLLLAVQKSLFSDTQSPHYNINHLDQVAWMRIIGVIIINKTFWLTISAGFRSGRNFFLKPISKTMNLASGKLILLFGLKYYQEKSYI